MRRSPHRRLQLSGTWIAGSLGVILVTALLVYAVTQATMAGPPGPSKSQQALQDDSPTLPGVYYAPHPGPDAQPGTRDDLVHFANGTIVPFCTEEQIAQGKLSDPSYGGAGVCYHSNPPTSGPHASSPMPFKVLDNPAPKENLIHNMEHGGVVVWVNTTNEAIRKEVESVVKDALDRRRLVVMTTYPDMEPETIALTGMTRLDKFPAGEFTKQRVQDFISEHQRRFNPEGF